VGRKWSGFSQEQPRATRNQLRYLRNFVENTFFQIFQIEPALRYMPNSNFGDSNWNLGGKNQIGPLAQFD